MTDGALEELLFPSEKSATDRRLPDYSYIRKELLRNGVTKKLLWIEYCEECRQTGEEPLMYSQFCEYIRRDEQKRRATMHIPRKPGEQIEVDWAGDPAHIIDPDTGEITDCWLFVGVLTYSQYTFVETFMNERTGNWIRAHVHMFEFFGGVTPMLVADNCTTAVDHRKSDWYTPVLNTTYHEMVEHYNIAILPARVRRPKDKPNKEVPFDDRFGMLIDIEYANRKNNRLKRLIRKAEFEQSDASVAAIDYHSGRKLNKALIQRMANCEYIIECRNIFITGATGSGKTYMACAFGMEACKQYYTVRYIRIPDLLLDLQAARDNGNFPAVLKKYTKPVLLIIDEWLLLKLTEPEAKNLFELIHKRRKKSSTIFCSQFREEEWYQQICGGESTLADTIMDRISYDSYKIDIESADPSKDISMREIYGLDPEKAR